MHPPRRCQPARAEAGGHAGRGRAEAPPVRVQGEAHFTGYTQCASSGTTAPPSAKENLRRPPGWLLKTTPLHTRMTAFGAVSHFLLFPLTGQDRTEQDRTGQNVVDWHVLAPGSACGAAFSPFLFLAAPAAPPFFIFPLLYYFLRPSLPGRPGRLARPAGPGRPAGRTGRSRGTY
eukprot:gene9073-biopygen21199